MPTDTKVKANSVTKQETHQGMVDLAREVEQHHLQPAPEATSPVPEPFPALVNWGLWLGVLFGAVLGLLFGVLLDKGVLVFEGWDNLFSMAPLAFHVFWVVTGIALGVVVGGIGTILAAKPEHDRVEPRSVYYEVEVGDRRVP